MTISDKRKIEASRLKSNACIPSHLDNIHARIRAYRESGVPYSEIAETLSLPLNTVKSYCKRHNLGGRRERTADNILLCKQCGEGVPQTPHRKAKIFCSDKCRMAWWNAHPQNVQRKSEQIFVCPVCGENFSAYASAKQRFCSRKCYGISKRGALHER